MKSKPLRFGWLVFEKLLFLYQAGTSFVLRKDSRKAIFDNQNSNLIHLSRIEQIELMSNSIHLAWLIKQQIIFGFSVS